MSTLNVSNIVTTTISDGTSTIDISTTSKGTVKAWLVCQSNSVILGSYNVSAVTDIGTGAYDIAFTVARPTANYAVLVTPAVTGGDYTAFGANRFTTSFQIQTVFQSSGSDVGFSAAVCGD